MKLIIKKNQKKTPLWLLPRLLQHWLVGNRSARAWWDALQGRAAYPSRQQMLWWHLTLCQATLQRGFPRRRGQPTICYHSEVAHRRGRDGFERWLATHVHCKQKTWKQKNNCADFSSCTAAILRSLGWIGLCFYLCKAVWESQSVSGSSFNWHNRMDNRLH